MESYVLPLPFLGKKLMKTMEKILVEEDCPTGHLSGKIDEITEMAAKKLDIEPKEVTWIIRAKKNWIRRKEKEEVEKENEESVENNKKHNQLLVELKTMNSALRKTQKHVEKINKNVRELEKSVTSMSFKNLGKDILITKALFL